MKKASQDLRFAVTRRLAHKTQDLEAFVARSIPRQSVLFPELLSKPVHAVFDEPETTSDGGALLFKALDESLGLTATLAEALRDERQEGKIRHSMELLLRQRLYALLCGYEDANDAARLGADPLHRLLVRGGDDPGDELASQPTLSRFENSVSGTDLLRLSRALAEHVFLRHRQRLRPKRVKLITLDMDWTVDQTHGEQQLTFFNGYYDSYCYLPLLGFIRFNDEDEQYLFSAMLREGSAHADGALWMLERTITRLRELFPRARMRVRLDAGFCNPRVLAQLEAWEVEYCVGIASNKVLKRISLPMLAKARREFDRTERTKTWYAATTYRAGSWNRKRRIVYKSEFVTTAGRDPRANQRFLVTNIKSRPEAVYKFYRERGDSENRIKELKQGLAIDRTSCSRFSANQFRVLMTATAYVFYQELRLRAGRTEAAHRQVSWLLVNLVKIAARVVRSARRYCLHLAQSHPHAELWLRLARACGACPT